MQIRRTKVYQVYLLGTFGYGMYKEVVRHWFATIYHHVCHTIGGYIHCALAFAFELQLATLVQWHHMLLVGIGGTERNGFHKLVIGIDIQFIVDHVPTLAHITGNEAHIVKLVAQVEYRMRLGIIAQETGKVVEEETLVELCTSHREGDIVGCAIIELLAHIATKRIRRDVGDEFAHIGQLLQARVGFALALLRCLGRFLALGIYPCIHNACPLTTMRLFAGKRQLLHTRHIKRHLPGNVMLLYLVFIQYLVIAQHSNPTLTVACIVGNYRSYCKLQCLILPVQVHKRFCSTIAYELHVHSQYQAIVPCLVAYLDSLYSSVWCNPLVGTVLQIGRTAQVIWFQVPEQHLLLAIQLISILQVVHLLPLGPQRHLAECQHHTIVHH